MVAVHFPDVVNIQYFIAAHSSTSYFPAFVLVIVVEINTKHKTQFGDNCSISVADAWWLVKVAVA